MNKWILFAFLVFGSSLTHAQQNNCVEDLLAYRNVQMHRFENPDTGKCYLSVRKKKPSEDMIYRSYLFTNKGMMMIFNSYGTGPYEVDTGAREFYFFPRRQNPEFKVISESDTVFITSANSEFATFDPENGQLVGLSGLAYQIDPNITPANEGGLQVINYKGIYLDVGYKTGESPSTDFNRSSRFVDRNNKVCTVKNSEIFIKVNGNVELKFQTDAEVSKFLKRKCSKFDSNI